MEQGYHEVIVNFLENKCSRVEFYVNKQGERFLPHWHDRVEILVVAEGCLQVFCDGETYEVNAGEFVYVNPYQIHSGTAGEDGVKYYVITTEYKLLLSESMDAGDQMILQLQNNERRVTNYIKNPELFHMFMHLTEIDHQKEICYEILMRGQLLLCLGKLAGLYSFAPQKNDKNAGRKNASIQQIIEYINEHYQEDISSQSLAEHFGFSLSYFSRYFKKESGENVTDYINSVRLSRAISMLVKTDRSMAEIAATVGYTSLSYFNKKFKESTGVTPLWYRKKWGNKIEK